MTKKITKADAVKAILAHLVDVDAEGGEVVYLNALAKDDNETTLRDLIKIAVRGGR